MDLNRDAMLVGLRITAWSGRLYDREASDHVAVHHDASASAGRYNKHLLPKAAFAALTSTMSEARNRHYENSLPWDDKRGRLLTVANYAHYTGLMDGLRERVVRQRARFIEDYDDYVDQARLDLGKLFRIDDYPSKEALQGKFAIRYRITPVPDADHFIAKLACDDTDRVKRDIERHIEEQLHDAVGDLYRRLGEAVERVSDRLREDGKSCHRSVARSTRVTRKKHPTFQRLIVPSTARPFIEIHLRLWCFLRATDRWHEHWCCGTTSSSRPLPEFLLTPTRSVRFCRHGPADFRAEFADRTVLLVTRIRAKDDETRWRSQRKEPSISTSACSPSSGNRLNGPPREPRSRPTKLSSSSRSKPSTGETSPRPTQKPVSRGPRCSPPRPLHET